ncbi:MAG: hypothetical protein ACR2NN_08500 [Bryobacteraceae bacterium]
MFRKRIRKLQGVLHCGEFTRQGPGAVDRYSSDPEMALGAGQSIERVEQ